VGGTGTEILTWLDDHSRHDLWRVKSLLARRVFGRLDERQRAELDRADLRDARVGTWFRWIWLAGYSLAGAYLTLFYLPVLWYVAWYTGAARVRLSLRIGLGAVLTGRPGRRGRLARSGIVTRLDCSGEPWPG
jgi:hypothetical protein